MFEAVLYVPRTECQLKTPPKERFGSAGAIHKRFLKWERAGFFETLWKAGLAEYDHRWRASRDDGSASTEWSAALNLPIPPSGQRSALPLT